MNQNADIFSRLFGDSLMTPIRNHMAVCHQTAETLIPFFDAVRSDDFERVHTIHLQVSELEQKADKLKKEVRLHLHSGLLLSVSRNDLLELVRAQDKIANAARDVAGLVCGRAIRIPKELQSDFSECVRFAIKAVEALNETLTHLDTLVGTGFVHSRTRAIEKGVDSVDDLERESDRHEHALREKLFALEDDMDPIEVMFLYQVIDLVGDLADRSQAVANRIRIIIAH